MAEIIQNLTEEEEEQKLAEQALIRREKLQKLIEEGKNPFEKVKYAVSAHSDEIKRSYEQLAGKEVTVAGRLMSRRIMGKASFAHIQDENGLLQIYEIGRAHV